VDKYDVDLQVRIAREELLEKLMEEIGLRLRHHSPSPGAVEVLDLLQGALYQTRENLRGMNG
jgi:hypothetical protein